MHALLLVLVVDIAAVLIGGVWIIRQMDQHARDLRRITYRLTFQSDLSPEQVRDWIEAISGTLRGSRWHLGGAPSVVFEMFGSPHGIIHRLRVPVGHETYIIPQLRIAGINATLEQDFDTRDWTKGIEVGLKHTTSPMRISDMQAVSTRLLGCFNNFESGQAMMMQIVVTPAAPVSLPIKGETPRLDPDLKFLHIAKEPSADDVQGWRTKLGEPNFIGTIRVVAYAQTDAAARELVDRPRKALASLRGPKTRFYRRLVTHNQLRDRVRKGSMPVTAPLQLSATELTSLIALPMGRPQVPGLAPTMARYHPPTAAMPSEGRVIGMAALPGAERPIAIPYKHITRHWWVCGPSGVGKTNLLINAAVQDINHGLGVFVIETKGDPNGGLFAGVLDRIPDNRIQDVVVIDINDTEMPVGYNVLEGGAAGIGEMGAIISALYDDVSRSLLSPKTLYHALHALAQVPGHTFIDLPKLLENFPEDSAEHKWQAYVAENVKSKEVRGWLQDLVNMGKQARDNQVRPLMNRTWEFTNRPEVRNLLGQRKSTISMDDIIRDNMILLINLVGPNSDKQTSKILGTLFANEIWRHAKRHKPDTPNVVYMDEFQTIAKFPTGLDTVLEQARAFNLAAVLGHQFIRQLSPEMVQTVKANTGTKTVFLVEDDDAAAFARVFQLDKADFMNLWRFQTINKIAIDAGISSPVTVETQEAIDPTGNASRVVGFSRHKYGRPREDVERDLDMLPGGFSDKPRPPKRKVTGGDLF